MKPSEWLSQMDGHDIRSANMLDSLDAEWREYVPQFTHKQTATIMSNRGLGGQLADDTGEKLIFGYTSANALASVCASQNSLKMGRGSAFRENVSIIANAGH